MIVSLRTRLVLAVSVLALTAIAAVALSARRSTRVEFLRFQQGHLMKERAALDLKALASLLDGRCCAAETMNAAGALLREDQVVVVTNEQGAMVAFSGSASTSVRPLRAHWDGAVLKLDGLVERSQKIETVTLQFRGQPRATITTSDGYAASVHVISAPRKDDEKLPGVLFLGSVDRRLLIATAIIGLLSVAMTWTIAHRIVRPISDLGRAAGELARGNLGRRVAANGSDEVAELARAFNAMAAELERQQTLRRGLVHDVAHELRTPLTALRCRLEAIIDGLAADPAQALAGANEEVRHLSRLVDDLQELALAEARELSLTVEDVVLADVACSAIRAAGLDGDTRLHLAIDPHAIVRADAIRLRQALLNLLTNADRHTPLHGTIEIRGSRRQDEVVIEVHNTGSSLDAEQLERVFDRFYRADPSRQRATGGAGLGLAVVKHLIEAQEGRVFAASGRDGVTFGFTLPAASPRRLNP